MREEGAKVHIGFRKCYNCGKPEHIKPVCPRSKVASAASNNVDIMLAVATQALIEDMRYWAAARVANC